MIRQTQLQDGRYEVTSDSGMVDIGNGPVKKIICTEAEIEYIEEVSEE